MPDTSKLSKYLKVENVRDGDTVTFLDGGVIVEKKFQKDGKDDIKPALEITVKFKGDSKTYTPNGTTVKILSKAWGTNTDKWVGKTAVLTVVPSPNGKDMVIAKPQGAAAESEEVPF